MDVTPLKELQPLVSSLPTWVITTLFFIFTAAIIASNFVRDRIRYKKEAEQTAMSEKRYDELVAAMRASTKGHIDDLRELMSAHEATLLAVTKDFQVERRTVLAEAIKAIGQCRFNQMSRDLSQPHEQRTVADELNTEETARPIHRQQPERPHQPDLGFGNKVALES